MPIATINPADNSLVKEYDELSDGEVNAAIETAHRVYGEWRLAPIGNRGAVLSRAAQLMKDRADELAPLLTLVYKVRDADEAVRMANASPFGLGATVYSRDAAAAQSVADELDSGMVWINHPTGTSPELPFGGVKRSGYGRELSHYGVGEFANYKLIRIVPVDSQVSGAGG